MRSACKWQTIMKSTKWFLRKISAFKDCSHVMSIPTGMQGCCSCTQGSGASLARRNQATTQSCREKSIGFGALSLSPLRIPFNNGRILETSRKHKFKGFREIMGTCKLWGRASPSPLRTESLVEPFNDSVILFFSCYLAFIYLAYFRDPHINCWFTWYEVIWGDLCFYFIYWNLHPILIVLN